MRNHERGPPGKQRCHRGLDQLLALGIEIARRFIQDQNLRPSEDGPGNRESLPLAPIPFGVSAALAISALATIYLGILPGRVLEYASRSAADLLR